jgi:hypothetical protein
MTQIKSELDVEAGASLGARLPFLAKLFAKFSAGVKAGSDRHKVIRRELRQYPNELIDLTNDLLNSANTALIGANRPRGLILLFDNLDRFVPAIVRQLLLDGCSLIEPMASHAIFTMPIDLHYGPDSPYHDSYGGHATILPMLTLRNRDAVWEHTAAGSPYNKGALDEMLKALNRRIDVKALFAKPADARLLVKLSGGCIRELLHLVNLACQKSFTKLGEPIEKISSAGVRRAIEEYRANLSEGLLPNDLKRLVAIARRDPEAQVLDEAMLQLLKRRIAFRYSTKSDRWVDVHPMVIETEGFKSAFNSGTDDRKS